VIGLLIYNLGHVNVLKDIKEDIVNSLKMLLIPNKSFMLKWFPHLLLNLLPLTIELLLYPILILWPLLNLYLMILSKT